MALSPVNPRGATTLAERSGPFRIDGEDYETDAAGLITRTTPAVVAVARNPRQAQIIRRRDRKQAERDSLNAQITELTAERDQAVIDIANLQTIIDNSV